MREALDALRGLKEALGPHAANDGVVHLTFDGPVAHLRLDRARRRNALTVGMMIALGEHVQALGAFDGSAVVLSSVVPDVFCAGGDLSELPHAPAEAARVMAVAMASVLDGLLDLPLVSVAALGGPGIGGGAELATACDYRLGTPGASLHFIQGRLGIAPGWGGAGRLVRHVGRRGALLLLGRGQPCGVDEGLATGLFDVRGAGEPALAAVEWLAPFLDTPPAALRAIKRQVVAAVPARRGEAAHEADAFAEVWQGPDHRAALAELTRHRR